MISYKAAVRNLHGGLEMKRKTGFTLIELLVVIAVIAILAAILFPVLTSAKETARQATCTSNMKQIGQAFQMYLQSWDDTYIQGDPWAKTLWNFMINKYTGSRKPANWNSSDKNNFFTCPSKPRLHYLTGDKKNFIDYYKMGPSLGLSPTTSPDGKPAYAFWASYSINQHLIMKAPKMSSWRYPSRSYLLLEGNDMETDFRDGPEWAPKGKFAHGEGMNITYIDCHVKWVRCQYDKNGSDDVANWTFIVPEGRDNTGPWTPSSLPEPQ